MANRQEIILTLKMLVKAGIDYTIVAPERTFQIEKEKETTYLADYRLDDFVLDIDKYDLYIATGGHPRYTKMIWYNPNIKKIARAFDDAKKPIAAVCGSLIPINNICRGRKVSVFPMERMVRMMKKAGAIVTENAIEVDGNLISVRGEMMTEMMVEKAIEMAREQQSKKSGKPEKPQKEKKDLTNDDFEKFPTT